MPTPKTPTVVPSVHDQATLNRLRQSRDEAALPPDERGRRAGRRWARDEASIRDLLRLEAANENGKLTAGGMQKFQSPNARSVGRHLADVLLGRPCSGDEAFALWLAILGTDADVIEDVTFANGFMTGALAAWSQDKPVVWDETAV